MKYTLSILSLLAFSATSFADVWSYDSVDTENNTKEDLSIQFSNWIIDTTDGELTVSNELKNYGSNSKIAISGSNNLNTGKITNQYGLIEISDAVLNSTGNILNQYGAKFNVNGTSYQNGDGNLEFQQGSTLNVFEDANFTVKNNITLYWSANINLEAYSTLTVNQITSLYENDTGFSINLGEGAKIITTTGTVTVKSITLADNAQITGNVKTSTSLTLGSGNVITGTVSATDVILNEGATVQGTITASNSLTLNNASIQLAQYAHIKGEYNLNNVGSKALTSGVELWIDADAVLNITLGNNSLAATSRDNALIYTLYGKTMGDNSAINIMLSDFVLDSSFEEGQTYQVALVYSRYSNISDWISNINLVDDSDYANFVADSLIWQNNALWVSVIAVPEPSTYAMIFGSLVLALAIYRRRK